MGAPKISDRSFFEEEVGLSLFEAAAKTVESYFGMRPAKSNPILAMDLVVPFEAGGLILFQADGTAVQMILGFEKNFLFELYFKMLGDRVTEINGDLLDCAAELTNIVYGYAKAPLVNKGHSFAPGRPEGTQDLNSRLKNKKSLEIPFQIQPDKKTFSLILSV